MWAASGLCAPAHGFVSGLCYISACLDSVAVRGFSLFLSVCSLMSDCRKPPEMSRERERERESTREKEGGGEKERKGKGVVLLCYHTTYFCSLWY